MATFKLTIGNPKPENGVGITKSKEGSPYIGGLEAHNGSHLLYDNAGNVFLEASKTLFIRGKKLFEELESKQVVVSDAHTLNALTIALSAIESIFVSGKEVNVHGENINLLADGTTQVLAPKIILGKINSEVLYGEKDGEIYETNEELYTENSIPDPVMTKRRFSTWWGKSMTKLLSDINDLRIKYDALVSKYNSHVHIGRPPTEKVSPSDYGETSDLDFAGHTAKNVSNMQASKTTSAV